MRKADKRRLGEERQRQNRQAFEQEQANNLRHAQERRRQKALDRESAEKRKKAKEAVAKMTAVPKQS